MRPKAVGGKELGGERLSICTDKVNDIDGFVVCIILIYSHNGQPIYISSIELLFFVPDFCAIGWRMHGTFPRCRDGELTMEMGGG